MNARLLPAMGCLLVLGASCQTANDTPAPTTAPPVVDRPTPLPGPAVVGTSFVFQRPANLPDLAANPAISRLTVEGIELGRQLFYDPNFRAMAQSVAVRAISRKPPLRTWGRHCRTALVGKRAAETRRPCKIWPGTGRFFGMGQSPASTRFR